MSSLEQNKEMMNLEIGDMDVGYGNTGVEFSSGGYEIRKILHKNLYTQRKLLKFEFWIDGELSKRGHHFSNKVI